MGKSRHIQRVLRLTRHGGGESAHIDGPGVPSQNPMHRVTWRQQRFIPYILEAGNSLTKVPSGSVSDEGPLPSS